MSESGHYHGARLKEVRPAESLHYPGGALQPLTITLRQAGYFRVGWEKLGTWLQAIGLSQNGYVVLHVFTTGCRFYFTDIQVH